MLLKHINKIYNFSALLELSIGGLKYLDNLGSIKYESRRS